MSNEVTLTKTEATAVLMLLKSLTYNGLNSEDGVSFQATLMNLGERIEHFAPDSDVEQYGLWERLGKPGWNTSMPSI